MPATISIVTATLNRRPLIERAIRSALAEGTTGVQHIVVDGGSTDGTLNLLEGFPHLEVVSEPDRNLYDGWNKGIARATGDFVFILNSDDEVVPGAFAEARRLAAANLEADLISGPVLLSRASGETVIIDDPRMVALREQDIGPGVPLTNGRFIARRLLERIGPFDIRYPVVSDRQFFLRALAAGARNVTTTHPIYRYHVHGGSLTLNDGGPSLAHARENLAASRDGLMEAQSAALRAGYRRWHAWSAFYLAGLEARRGQVGAGMRTLGAAMARDALLPLRLAPLVARHAAERAARRGRPYAD